MNRKILVAIVMKSLCPYGDDHLDVYIDIIRRMMHFDISVAWFTKLFLQFLLSLSPS